MLKKITDKQEKKYMTAKVEIFTFSIINKSNNDVKIKFEGETLKEIFKYLKKNIPNKVNQFPPGNDKKTYKIDTYIDEKSKEQKSYFEFSEPNNRLEGVFVVGRDADKVLKFTSADKHKKESGQKEKGVNIDNNHYFQILFIEGSDSGFIVLEKNQKSCKKEFGDILEFILNQLYSGVQLSLKQFIEREFYMNYLKDGSYNSITCVRKGVKTENNDGILNIINQGTYKIETKLTTSGDIKDQIKNSIVNAFEDRKNFIEIPEFIDLNYTTDNGSYLIINSEYNGKSRTIDLSDVLKVRPIYDLDDVKENSDGNSNFKSIRNKVNELLTELDINIY